MNSISILKLPQNKEEQLLSKKLETTQQLAEFFPRRYIDLRKGRVLEGVIHGEVCAIDGKCTYKDSSGLYPTAHLMDDNLDVLEIIWFGNSTYYFDQFSIGKDYRVAGRISFKRGNYSMSNPSIFFELGTNQQNARICPIYPKIKGMSENYLVQCINKAIAVEETHFVPDARELVAGELSLMDHFDAIREIHAPTDGKVFLAAQKRLAFEAIYEFYSQMKKNKREIPIAGYLTVTSRDRMDKFVQSLPFSLTAGQSSAIEQMADTALSHQRIDTLVSGDVGCGKTLVAETISILMWENGFQTAIMAPTLVLAKQHYEEMTSRIPEDWGKKPVFALLTSETKKKERTKILKGLETGEIDILIGTSSILSDELEFKRLGMTIIDEEHKFGTAQKEILEKKVQTGLHHVSMTATPIPRSLARTIYGTDLGIITIETMPKGRKPVVTQQSSDRIQMFEQLAEQVKLGHQAYVICPFISDSDSERFQDVDSVESVHKEMEKHFSRTHPSIRLGCITGKMAPRTLLTQINRFVRGEIDILVSTTIVEVGVNVPNATAIMICSADRFGLSALHQLRGRVGRGSDQSYCLLATRQYTEKLEVLCQNTSGFVVAEEDMRLRGPGDLTGEAQTGYSEAIELIIKRPKLARAVREKVFGGQGV